MHYSRRRDTSQERVEMSYVRSVCRLGMVSDLEDLLKRNDWKLYDPSDYLDYVIRYSCGNNENSEHVFEVLVSHYRVFHTELLRLFLKRAICDSIHFVRWVLENFTKGQVTYWWARGRLRHLAIPRSAEGLLSLAVSTGDLESVLWVLDRGYVPTWLDVRIAVLRTPGDEVGEPGKRSPTPLFSAVYGMLPSNALRSEQVKCCTVRGIMICADMNFQINSDCGMASCLTSDNTEALRVLLDQFGISLSQNYLSMATELRASKCLHVMLSEMGKDSSVDDCCTPKRIKVETPE